MIANRLYNTITSIEPVINYMKSKSYYFNKKYLQIVNIRSMSRTAGDFDDLQIAFWNNTGKWEYIKFIVTTDPGQYYLLNPLNSKGTAIVYPHNYTSVWKLGLHRGKYKALVQANDIVVIRDNNRDSFLDIDFDNYTKQFISRFIEEDNARSIKVRTLKNVEVILEKGLFGINCHRASKNTLLEKIGKYSAGCCVHQDSEGFDALINLCESRDQDTFTATWIEELDFNRYIYNLKTVKNES